MGIGIGDQLVGPLGGGIERLGLFHRVGSVKRHLGVGAIDR